MKMPKPADDRHEDVLEDVRLHRQPLVWVDAKGSVSAGNADTRQRRR